VALSMDEEQIVEKQSAASRRKKCGRRLSCGIHFCKKKKACEDSACPPCSAQITKKCRCGATTKRFKCHEYHARLRLEGADSWIRCSKKCKRLKTCGKHQCDAICCPGRTAKNFEGHQCLEVCDKLLRCGRHRCDSLCHYGACNPCDVLYADGFACRCGAVRVSEPFLCGTVHIPACTSTCDTELACGHRCRAKCGHSGACPPCVRLCSRPCATHGVMVPRMQCNVIQRFCSKPCGKVLDCGVHVCRRKCHSGPCAEKWVIGCKRICDQPLRCGHKCKASCHVLDGDCDARLCKVQITVKCKCGESSEKQYCRGRTAKEIEAAPCTEHCHIVNSKKHIRDALNKSRLLKRTGRVQLLVCGYLRRRCRVTQAITDIVKLISAFHPNPVVYGLGSNEHYELGIGKRLCGAFTRLEEMSSLLEFDCDLHMRCGASMIFNRSKNTIDCAGNTERGLCLVPEGSDVSTFAMHSMDFDLQSAVVSEGLSHVMIKDSQHTLYGFGIPLDRQLGDTCSHEKLLKMQTHVVRKLHLLNAAFPLSLRQKVTSIKTGFSRSFLLLSDGRVFGVGALPCWNGRESVSAAPVHLETLCDIKQIACGLKHNVFVDAQNRVFVNGSNGKGQLGFGYTSWKCTWKPQLLKSLEYDSTHELEVHCGFYHTLIIDVTAMNAVAFGCNESGQIGAGQSSGESVPHPFCIAKENSLKVVHGSAGSHATLLVTQSNELYWCGHCGVWGLPQSIEGIVWTPTLVSKQEIGIADTERITRVVAGEDVLLVIVNKE